MSSPLPNDLVPLIESLIDGTIDDAGFERLNTILADSAEARALYRRYMNLQAVLPGIVGQSPRLSVQLSDVGEEELPLDTHEMPQAQLISLLLQLEATGKDIDPTSLESDPSDITLEDDPGSISRHDMLAAGSYLLRHSLTPKVVAVLATAAALLLGVTLMILLSGNEPQQQPVVISTDVPDESTPVMEVVATLTAAQNARWAEGDLSLGSEFRPNQRLTLTAGFAEITTRRGAVAVIDAPATIELLDNDNALHLHAGKLVGICETETSKGFLVRTPHMDITDLGTRFGIDADADATEVHVFEGEVQALAADADEAEVPTLLLAGESASISSTLHQVVKIQHESEAFAKLLPETIQLPGTGFGLKTGEADPNWQIVAIAGQTLDSPQALSVDNNPIYMRNIQNDPAKAQWIAWHPDQEPPAVGGALVYTFRTQLHIPESFDLNTASIAMRYAVDNQLRSIRINGRLQPIGTAQRVPGAQGVFALVMGDLFQAGNNVIELDIANIRTHESLAGKVGLWAHWEIVAQ